RAQAERHNSGGPAALPPAPPPHPPAMPELSATPFTIMRWSPVRPPLATSDATSPPPAPTPHRPRPAAPAHIPPTDVLPDPRNQDAEREWIARARERRDDFLRD